MIVLPSWEGQGQLKTLGTLVLVKQTLAQESRHPAQLCRLVLTVVLLKCGVDCEQPPDHIWSRSEAWVIPSPAIPQSPGPGDVLTSSPGVFLSHDQDERNHSEALCFGYGRNVLYWNWKIHLQFWRYIWSTPIIPSLLFQPTGKIDAYLGCNLYRRSFNFLINIKSFNPKTSKNKCFEQVHRQTI